METNLNFQNRLYFSKFCQLITYLKFSLNVQIVTVFSLQFRYPVFPSLSRISSIWLHRMVMRDVLTIYFSELSVFISVKYYNIKHNTHTRPGQAET